MVERAFDVFVFNLNVGKGCQAARAPVYKAFAPVDESFFMQADKDFPHGPGKALIHRKA